MLNAFIDRCCRWINLLIALALVILATWAGVTTPDLTGQAVDCYLTSTAASQFSSLDPVAGAGTDPQPASGCWLASDTETLTGTRRIVSSLYTLGDFPTPDPLTMSADERIAEWKRAHMEPPPPDLEASVAQARALQNEKRLSYDSEGRLAQNQMGTFKYLLNSLDAGLVTLNERMRILGALVGEAFTYATVAHEAQHARDHAAGRLSPEQEIAGELSAFRIQYLWLKLMDPSGERMLTLHGSLKMRMLRETDPEIKAALNEAVVYLEHLSDVVATNGKKDELKKLIEKLGYSDGHKHGHGDDDHNGRGAALPASA